jgi:hypothetical protein
LNCDPSDLSLLLSASPRMSVGLFDLKDSKVWWIVYNFSQCTPLQIAFIQKYLGVGS